MNGAEPSSEEGLIERFPHYKTYKACQSQAFMASSVTLLGGAAITYVLMDVGYKKFKPTISRNWQIAAPILIGALSAYLVIMGKTTNCQNMWMAMEERHSVLTPANERLAMRTKSDQ
ncbi:unnamed protein product [Lymnaea stagnalis]|uniref:Transmembrane protein 141 n=1 Tax=Lymnaea stagnalis TaxID=6523 RepID=A0AAV2H178_LYMST